MKNHKKVPLTIKCPDCKKTIESRKDSDDITVFACKCSFYGWWVNDELVPRYARIRQIESEEV